MKQKIVMCTTVEDYLNKINDLKYEIEKAKFDKVWLTGVCLFLAGLNISHISQLNDPELLEISRQVALTISLAYSTYKTKKVFKVDKINQEKLGRAENRYYDLTKENRGFLRDKEPIKPVFIDEQYENYRRHR